MNSMVYVMCVALEWSLSGPRLVVRARGTPAGSGSLELSTGRAGLPEEWPPHSERVAALGRDLHVVRETSRQPIAGHLAGHQTPHLCTTMSRTASSRQIIPNRTVISRAV